MIDAFSFLSVNVEALEIHPAIPRAALSICAGLTAPFLLSSRWMWMEKLPRNFTKSCWNWRSRL